MDSAVSSKGLLRAFKLAMTVDGLRPSTVSHYVRDASRFLDSLDGGSVEDVTRDDVRAWVAGLQERYAPKTVRESQLGLRRFLRFLVTEGELESDPTANMKLISVRVGPQPTYSESEVKRLLLVCDPKQREGVRNRALVLTLFDTGVREGELISMGFPDWDRRAVRVEGKTGVRVVPLGLATVQAIERYARRWRISEAPLWRGKRGTLTGSGVLQVVRRLCRQAGVEDKGVHAFRRAAAAQMKRLGMNDSDILEVMGWRSIEMPRRYTAAVAGELAQEAHRRYSPGDALRGTV